MSKPGGCHSSGISLGDALRLPERHPACRRREAQPGSYTERENLCPDAKGEITSGSNREDQSTNAEHRGGAARSRDEGSVMELDRRGCVVKPSPWAHRSWPAPPPQGPPRRYLEPRLEPMFHTDSYGYRPGRSAIDAVRRARQRCWRGFWVRDIGVEGY